MRRRWGDNDRYFGPFTYSRDKGYRPLALVVASGEDDYPGSSVRLSAFGHTFISPIPGIIKPWRQWVDTSGYDWSTNPNGGYWDVYPRHYGFSLSEGFLQFFYGAQTHDSETDQSKGYFLPWTQWRHVRHSFYGLAGEYITDEVSKRADFEHWRAESDRIDAAVPTVTFSFIDYDGEPLTARTRMEEREWRLGKGKFKWLAWFRKPTIRRSLAIQFSGETGTRKGSWKGGTIGHSIDMLPGELHEAAFERYCRQHDMAFIGEVASL